MSTTGGTSAEGAPATGLVEPTPPAAATSAAPSRRAWAGVFALALGAFIMVMTETLPVGLLPQVADGLHVSLSLAGLIVLVPGLSAAVAAPLFFLGSGRFNRRSLILAFGLTVLVSNVVAAVSPDFALVLIARLVFGATLGAFWVVVLPIGPRLVGAAAGTRAITIIAAGISGGTVVGLPAGEFLGNLVGWHLTFAIAAAATLLVVVLQALVLPSVTPDGHTHVRDLIGVVTRPAARFAMAAGAVMYIGQFTAWTYITPFLMDHTHLSSGVISLLYVIYGCGGIAGSIIAGSLFKRGVIGSFAGAATVLAGLIVGLVLAGTLPWLAGLLLVMWGLLWGILNPGTVVWMLAAAPETPEAAATLNVTNLQIALAAGSGLGAILISSATLQTVFLTAGFVVLAAAALAAMAARFGTLARGE
jgi:predicted MFS family arabinose efflux permease